MTNVADCNSGKNKLKLRTRVDEMNYWELTSTSSIQFSNISFPMVSILAISLAAYQMLDSYHAFESSLDHMQSSCSLN